MHDDDRKRVEREQDLADSVKGPDYSQLKAELRAVHGELARRDGWAQASYQERMIGYNEAVRAGRIKPVNGQIPPFGEQAPGSQLEKADTGWAKG